MLLKNHGFQNAVCQFTTVVSKTAMFWFQIVFFWAEKRFNTALEGKAVLHIIYSLSINKLITRVDKTLSTFAPPNRIKKEL